MGGRGLPPGMGGLLSRDTSGTVFCPPVGRGWAHPLGAALLTSPGVGGGGLFFVGEEGCRSILLSGRSTMFLGARMLTGARIWAPSCPQDLPALGCFHTGKPSPMLGSSPLGSNHYWGQEGGGLAPPPKKQALLSRGWQLWVQLHFVCPTHQDVDWPPPHLSLPPPRSVACSLLVLVE